ncbi:MAG: DUF1801 domain-containing protein [Bacteroidetes bacterium]|nr:DUF1801 domain-containing protein [Bacteroidota bacterium]
MKKEQFSSVDQYIAAQPSHAKKILESIRTIIKKAVPKGEEVISYQMPAVKFHGMLIWYAVFKDHYSIFPKTKAIVAFKDKLKLYEVSKGTIKFPIDKTVPIKLITDIVKYRVKENIVTELQKEKKKLKKKK